MRLKISLVPEVLVFLFMLPGIVMAQNKKDNYERRICTWAAVGPFSPSSGDGLDQDFLGDEAAASPKLGDPINGMKWLYFDDRLYCRNHDDYNDFFTFYMEKSPDGPGGGTEDKVAYAASYVWSPDAREARIEFGANEKARVWLNGKVELEITTPTQALRDGLTKNVHLQSGWNRILVKVVNIYEIWGFYFNLTNPDGTRMEGLEYSPEKPEAGKALQIVTQGMPTAYTTQPYVHLYVQNPKSDYPADNPSASPYRFCGAGGTPPYSWVVTGLPSGLSLDAAEGEILGKTQAVQEVDRLLTVTLTDSSSPPQSVQKQFTLAVRPRVTKAWWEVGTRIGGLRHGGQLWFDKAEEQAVISKRQGVSWIAPTGLEIYQYDGKHIHLVRNEATEHYKKTMRAHGIRICNYMGIPTSWPPEPGKPDRFIKPNVVGLSALHERIRLHLEQDQPGLFWLDGASNLCRQLAGIDNWEFDAQYSLIKTVDPDCLVLANAGGGDHRDFELGDIDLLSLEGNNNHSSVNYWTRWPTEEKGAWWRNPKYLPIDSWRFSEPAASDWVMWTKTLIAMLGETENLKHPRMFNFDQTPGPETLAMHKAMGDWIAPRADGVTGVFPEAKMTVGDLGYCVRDMDHPGTRYIQLTSNERRKTGWTNGDVKVENVGFNIAGVKLYPDMKELPFKQVGQSATIDMTGVTPDPVATLLQVTSQPMQNWVTF